MIDIHSHILPNVDDGSSSIEESIEMAKIAVNEGIHTIIATPHFKNGKYTTEKETVYEKVEMLQTILHNEKIPLTILPSQEIRLKGEFLEDYEKSRLLPLDGINGKYVLIELPTTHVPHFTEQLIFEIRLLNLQPIIAHPERNMVFLQDYNRLYQLINSGCLTQITTGSLVGKFGKKIEEFTHQLIYNNYAHLLATDSHNTTTRSCYMKESLQMIEKTYGQEVKQLFIDNADALLSNKMIQKEIPEYPMQFKKKKRFLFF